jgi:hypothetical protein
VLSSGLDAGKILYCPLILWKKIIKLDVYSHIMLDIAFKIMKWSSKHGY